MDNVEPSDRLVTNENRTNGAPRWLRQFGREISRFWVVLGFALLSTQWFLREAARPFDRLEEPTGLILLSIASLAQPLVFLIALYALLFELQSRHRGKQTKRSRFLLRLAWLVVPVCGAEFALHPVRTSQLFSALIRVPPAVLRAVGVLPNTPQALSAASLQEIFGALGDSAVALAWTTSLPCFGALLLVTVFEYLSQRKLPIAMWLVIAAMHLRLVLIACGWMHPGAIETIKAGPALEVLLIPVEAMGALMGIFVLLAAAFAVSSKRRRIWPASIGNQPEFRYSLSAVLFIALAGATLDLVHLRVVSSGLAGEDPALTTSVGIAWIVALPWIALYCTFLGPVVGADTVRTQWREVFRPNGKEGMSRHRGQRRESSAADAEDGSTRDRAAGRRLALRFVDALGMASRIGVVAFQTSPLQITVGVLLNVALSLYGLASISAGIFVGRDIATPINAFTLLNMWLASVALWALPVVSAVTNLHLTLQKGVELQLQRSIARAHGHVVVAGFGDMARRVVRGLFAIGELRVDKYLACSDVYTPQCERVVLIEDLLCIDRDREAFLEVVHTPRGDVGLVKVDAGIRDETTCAIGLLADINSAQTLARARVPFAKNFLCLAGAEEVTYSATDFHMAEPDERRRGTVIAVSSTASISYFARESLRTAFAQMHAGQIRTMAVAHAIVSVLVKRAADCASPGTPSRPILIVGSGIELIHLVDGLLRAAGAAQQRITWPVQVITTDPEIGARLVTIDPSRTTPVWSTRAVGPWKEFVFQPLGDEHVLRRVIPDYSELRVEVLPLDPRGDSVVQSVLRDGRHEVICVTEPDPYKQMRVLSAVLRAIKSIYGDASEGGGPARLPAMIIGAETGRDGRTRNLGDAAAHYYNWAKRLHGRRIDQIERDGWTFPRQFGRSHYERALITGDLLVDVLDDPAQRICGIVRSHRQEDPFEMSFCVRWHPGSLADIICRASGFQRVGEIPAAYRHVGLPCVTNSRMYSESKSRFFIQSNVRLVSQAGSRDAQRAFRAAGSIKRAVYFPMGRAQGDRWLDSTSTGKAWNGRFLRDAPQLDTEEERGAHADEDCPQMISCPVASFLRQLPALEAFENPLARRCTFANCAPALDGSASNGESLASHYETLRMQPHSEGRLVLDCEHGDAPGTVARVLSALIFNRVEVSDKGNTPVFNIFYCSDQPCHNSRFSIVTIHGGVEANSIDRGDHRFPLRTMIVRPTSGGEPWSRYLMALASFLNRAYVEPGSPWTVQVVRERDVKATAARSSILGGTAEPNSRTSASGSAERIVLFCLYRGGLKESPVGQFARYKKCCETCEGTAQCRICAEFTAALGGVQPSAYDIEALQLVGDPRAIGTLLA